jgi:hypothetical protein
MGEIRKTCRNVKHEEGHDEASSTGRAQRGRDTSGTQIAVLNLPRALSTANAFRVDKYLASETEALLRSSRQVIVIVAPY